MIDWCLTGWENCMVRENGWEREHGVETRLCIVDMGLSADR